MKNSGQKNFIFAGGGTGGHLYPAIAMAQELKRQEPAAVIHFVGTRRGIEEQVVPRHGFILHRISVRGVRRSFALSNLLVPFVLIGSMIQSAALMLKLKPAAVVGTGGYVSGPVLFAATILRFPTLIQEQNSFPGVTTRLLSRWVDRIHISYEASRRYFRRAEKLFLSGNPVRLFAAGKSVAESRRMFQLSPDRDTVLVFGGSQGAEMLNRTLAASLPRIMEKSSLQLLWSTGEKSLPAVTQAVAPFAERVRVFPFIEDMENAYHAATFCLTRAGALTCAEIAVCGLPAILIPYPFAAANHQEMNALAIEQNGGAQVILQRQLTPDLLAERIIELANNREKRKEMAEAVKRLSFPRATQDLALSILELAGGQKHE